MPARQPLDCMLCLLAAMSCGDSLAAAPDASASKPPEPLPADMLRACPGIERFKRTSSGPCTEIGCVNGLRLEVSPSSAWPSGAYRFELTVDDRNITCQGAIPLEPCTQRSFTCDADGVSLGESGCALGASQQGIASISFDGYPLDLTIRMLRDGAQVAMTQLTPQYTAGQPNGPGCEPVCCGASGTFAVF